MYLVIHKWFLYQRAIKSGYPLLEFYESFKATHLHEKIKALLATGQTMDSCTHITIHATRGERRPVVYLQVEFPTLSPQKP